MCFHCTCFFVVLSQLTFSKYYLVLGFSEQNKRKIAKNKAVHFVLPSSVGRITVGLPKKKGIFVILKRTGTEACKDQNKASKRL